MPGERRGGRSQKPHQGKCQLGIKKIQFTMKLVKYWLSSTGCPERLWDLHLVIFKAQLGKVLNLKLDLLWACRTSWPLKVCSNKSDSMNKKNLRWFTPDQNSLWEKLGFVRDPILSMGAIYNVLKLSLTGSPTKRKARRWKSKTKANYSSL